MSTESANEFKREQALAKLKAPLNSYRLLELAETTTLPEEHLAALEELERYRTALEAIRTHQASVGVSMSRYSTTWHIADRALNPSIRERIESEVGE